MAKSYQSWARYWLWMWAGLSVLLMWSSSTPHPVSGGPHLLAWFETASQIFHGAWNAAGAGLLRRSRILSKPLAVWAVIAAFSSVLEIGQGWVPGRGIELLDVSWNLTGAALGARFLGLERTRD